MHPIRDTEGVTTRHMLYSYLGGAYNRLLLDFFILINRNVYTLMYRAQTYASTHVPCTTRHHACRPSISGLRV